MSSEEKIDALRRRIERRNNGPVGDYKRIEYLAVTKISSRFHLSFYGAPYGGSCTDLMTTLCDPEVAECLQTLVLAGPDVGANGTNDWNIEPLVSRRVVFGALESLEIQLFQPGDHNGAIVTRGRYDEDGVIAKLVELSPQLRHLTVPSAPDESFFAVKNNRIEYLNVDAGMDHQNFIRNLARFRSLPFLRSFGWGEFNPPYQDKDDWTPYFTPIEDYKALFRSPQFEMVKRFVWRDPACSAAEIQEIVSLRSNLNPLIVRSTACWAKDLTGVVATQGRGIEP